MHRLKEIRGGKKEKKTLIKKKRPKMIPAMLDTGVEERVEGPEELQTKSRTVQVLS